MERLVLHQIHDAPAEVRKPLAVLTHAVGTALGEPASQRILGTAI